jgi:RNA polymerase subunit RPABC4/transcription elongation factor Spt4
MMKCCEHCGALLEDDALACPHCGTAYETLKETAVAVQPQTEETVTPLSKKKLNKKTILFITGGILITVVAVILVNNSILLSALSTAVKHYEEIINGDAQQLSELAPMEYWETKAQQQGQSVDKYLSRKSSEIERTFGSSKTSYSLEIVYREAVSNDEQKSIKSTLEERFGITPHRVKSVQRLILKENYRYGEFTGTSGILIIAVQIDSQWYLINERYNDLFIICGLISDGMY